MIGRYSLFGLLGVFILALGMRTYFQLAVLPGEVRMECSERARMFVVNRQKTKQVYTTTSANQDYEFVYKLCFQEKGLRPE